MVKPTQSRIKSGGGLWIADTLACKAENDSQSPHIQQAPNGTIYAYYGASRYHLDKTAYKECHVIGYDGVGCYL